ncbi:uncharacterized protein IWZ02DRAFT_449924 [Phyllosticta citriasiana]|uniref:uncharacterized protein n=1 Tax=Phyllosticta citriasiana TaxID=595635 RepID=UPI0030FDBC18
MAHLSILIRATKCSSPAPLHRYSGTDRLLPALDSRSLGMRLLPLHRLKHLGKQTCHKSSLCRTNTFSCRPCPLTSLEDSLLRKDCSCPGLFSLVTCLAVPASPFTTGRQRSSVESHRFEMPRLRLLLNGLVSDLNQFVDRCWELVSQRLDHSQLAISWRPALNDRGQDI